MVSPMPTPWSPARSTSRITPFVGQVGGFALDHLGLEDAGERAGVHRRDELVRLRPVGIGDVRAGEGLRGHRGDAVGGGDLLGDRGGEASEPTEPHRLGLHDEVAVEPSAHLLVDRCLGRRAEHREQADERHADDERGGGGRGALRAARGVLDREASGDARHLGDGPAAEAHAGPGEHRADDDGGDEHEQGARDDGCDVIGRAVTRSRSS